MQPPPGKLRAIWDKIREKLYELAQKLLAMARDPWQNATAKLRWTLADPGATALEIGPQVLRKLCDFIASHALAQAAPFIGAGLDIAKGVLNTIDAGLTRYREWAASSIVSLVMAAVEALAKTIWKLVEVVKMRSAFARGRELWEARMNPDSLHLRPIAFNAWFRSHALSSYRVCCM